MENKRSFPCDQCGKCCQNVHKSHETVHLDRGDGTCLLFDINKKLCRIYDIRPLICRVDEQYEMNYKKMLHWDEFVALNQKACELLKKL